jgi:hypothetical protein
VRALVLFFAGVVLLAIFAFLGFGMNPIDRILYEAETVESKRALASRIEALRTVLRADPHFEERQGQYPLLFVGSDWLQYNSCAITYVRSTDGLGSDRLRIWVHHYWRPWNVPGRVQDRVDKVLGPEVVRQLKVTIHRVLLQ